MSDTPRTDAEAEMLPIYGSSDSEWVNAKFARQLERELERVLKAQDVLVARIATLHADLLNRS